MEAALAAHFGRPVAMKLVLDEGATAVPSSAQPGPAPVEAADVPGRAEWEDMTEAGAAVTPEQRLLDAFPGAEEIS